MKHPILALAAAALAISALQAQPFEVQTIFVGVSGGVSRGGTFAVSGVAGQPEPGSTAGGDVYSLSGGWPGPLILDSPDMPRLVVRYDLATSSVIVSWPASSQSLLLDERTSLSDPAGWSVSSAVSSVVDTNRQVTLPVAAASRFFRLRRSP